MKETKRQIRAKLRTRRPTDSVEKLLAQMYRRKTALLEEAGNYKSALMADASGGRFSLRETSEMRREEQKLHSAANDLMRAIELVRRQEDLLPTY